jgi:hypothetical protein
LSGLKINYHKSEAFMFGMDEEEKTRIANMLNCQLGGLPMKYLGVPVSDVKLGRGAFKNVSEKISKRTPLDGETNVFKGQIDPVEQLSI